MRRLAVLLAFSLALNAGAANHGLERGFSPDKLYDFGSIDAINTFNGNLTLRVPLSGTYPVNGSVGYSFGLSYNSKVWDYEQIVGQTRAIPNRRANAGMGWLLSLGRLIAPNDPVNETNAWIYESPDGASHEFVGALNGATTSFAAPVTAVLYTVDGTYLRMLQKNDGTIDVELPDGAVHTFTAGSGKLARIRDRFNNSVSVAYSPLTVGTPCPASDNYVWTFTDSKSARTNYVCFSNRTYPDSTYEGQVERLVLAAPPTPAGVARTATWLFTYVMTSVSRGCHATYTPDPIGVTVPLLSTISLPDGSSYAFTYNATGAGVCAQGTLKTARLPTLATHTYGYRYYQVPADECEAAEGLPNSYLTGVGTKTITGTRLPAATWSYTSALSPRTAQIQCELPGGATTSIPGPSEELTVTLTDPLGYQTANYYSVWPGANDSNSAAGFRATEYGLPLTRFQSEVTAAGTGVYLSTRSFQGASAKRSRYVRYLEPATQPCYMLAGCGSPADPRVVAARTLHHDDGSAADAEYSEFDGLGHFRRTKIAGTGSLAAGSRETFVAYNTRDPEVNPTTGIASGTYTPGGPFTLPPATTPWLVNQASHVLVTENGLTAKTQACHDATTGFLRATRALKTGTTRASTDTVVVYTPESGTGNLAGETYFGGDIRNNASTSTPLCTVATSGSLPAHDYRIDHTYDWGLRVSSKYSGASFFHLQRTVDRASGVTLTSTNTSGGVTSYTYDVPGRLTVEAPPDLLGINYTYANASGSVPASVLVKHGLRQSQYQYDALGRLWREKTYMPDNSWSVRQTLYDAAGNVSEKSEQEKLVITTTEWAFTPANKTQFLSYDPFGRAGVIRAPDGKETTIAYTGVSAVDRTVNVNGTGGEAPVRTTENHDRQGRLVSVVENAGSPTGKVTTTYSYDVGGRLKLVSMPGAGSAVQTRTFTYDNRGFLASEQHPELGVSGNGTRSYKRYDARGHAHQQFTGTEGGPFDLSFTFDEAERVTRVSLTGSGLPLKDFDYDDPTGAVYGQCVSGLCNGKLAAAARYNYTADLGGTIAVTEAYQYDGRGGTVSRRDMAVGTTSLFTGDNFNAAQNYTTIGDLQTLYYPCRTDGAAPNGCNQGDQPMRAVVNNYTNGYPTGLSSIAPSITYAPNGMIDTVTHGSGAAAVRETIVADPKMARPCGIFVYGPGVTLLTDGAAPCGRLLSGTGAQWSSGAYSYDAAGNVMQIGGNTYRYDPFGRLTSWTTAAGTASRTYDNFGNALGTGLTVSGTTNHYAGVTYDAAGNVTNDGKGTYTYDALGMMTAATVGGRQYRYLYMSDDERAAAVERVVVGGNVRTKTTWTLRGLGPQLQRVYSDDNSSGTRVVSWKEDTFWRGGQLLGSDTPTGLRHYGLDHLGSPRLITDAAGAFLGTQDFTPFGTGGTSNGGTLQFTGHERDAASLGAGAVDLPDYMHARFYRAEGGRFLSVDPKSRRAPLKQPQLYNRYSYAMNNPLNFVDLDGEDVTPVRLLMTGGKPKVAYVDSRMVPRLQNLVTTAHKQGVAR